MSQVHHKPIKEPLSTIIKRLGPNDSIVQVKGPLASKHFRVATFPKETHFEKKEETKYYEYVDQYLVVKTIRPSSLNNADSFWVWTQPHYSLENVRRHHERGLLASPSIRKRQPDFPIEGKELILFIRKLEKNSEEFPLLYSIVAREGTKAEKEIRRLLKKLK